MDNHEYWTERCDYGHEHDIGADCPTCIKQDRKHNPYQLGDKISAWSPIMRGEEFFHGTISEIRGSQTKDGFIIKELVLEKKICYGCNKMEYRIVSLKDVLGPGNIYQYVEQQPKYVLKKREKSNV